MIGHGSLETGYDWITKSGLDDDDNAGDTFIVLRAVWALVWDLRHRVSSLHY